MFNVYALRSRSDEVIYVGVTRKLDQRIASHRTNQAWRSEIYRCEVLAFHEHEDIAREAERQWIARYQPRHNVQGNPLSLKRNTGRIDPGTMRRLREQKGWSMQDLAERVPCSANMIFRLERGERSGSPRMAKAIATALGVDLNFLGDRTKVVAA